jgi:hypothetical protein
VSSRRDINSPPADVRASLHVSGSPSASARRMRSRSILGSPPDGDWHARAFFFDRDSPVSRTPGDSRGRAGSWSERRWTRSAGWDVRRVDAGTPVGSEVVAGEHTRGPIR